MNPSGARVLPDLLRRRAAEDGGRVALVVHRGGRLSYREWERRSNAVAGGLARRGVDRGDRVALLFDNARWLDYAVCYVAAQKAGAVAVPLAPRFSPAELAHVLAHSGAVGLVGPADLSAALTPGPGPAWVTDPDDLGGQSQDGSRLDTVGDDLAEIVYTSGTTGMPKGVACSHANLLFHELPADPEPRPGHDEITFLHAFPVGTNAGQEVLRVPLRRAGTTAVALAEFDPEALCQAVAEHRVKRLQLVPAMAQMLLQSGAHRRHDLSSLERVTLSSAPAPPALLSRLAEELPHVALSIAYALTESGTARTLLADAESRPGSVGRPVGGAEVQVVDVDGRALPAGETGEVWLRRVGAPRRTYFRDPQATQGLFAGDWLRTGDLGYLDGDGYLYVVDRKKDVIIVGGANVSSVQVENVLYEHPAVAEAAAFGVPHPVLGQDVAAAVVASRPVTARELQAFARRRLAERETPHRIVFLDRLPRNASGKVLKRELASEVGEEVDAHSGAPRTALEQLVVSVWKEVLGQPDVGVDDDFFALGGHSLAATQVAARLGDATGVDLAPTAVFEAPTVAELAALVDRGQRG